MSETKTKTTNAFTVEDLLRIKEYSRIASQMPSYLEDVITCLGYENSPYESLSPQSFQELFQSINNNGRYWNTETEKSFEERLNAMTNLYHQHIDSLNNALQVLNEMIDNNELGDMIPVSQAIRDCWSDMIYEVDKNDLTSQKLEQFKNQAVQTSSDIQTKLDLENNIDDSDIKKFLFDLKDELRLIINFSTEAEISANNLWTEWRTISEQLEIAKNAADSVTEQSDLADLYIALLDIVDGLNVTYEETQYMLECFTTADNRYESEYPGKIAPLGSYIDNCKNITLLLKAECETASGSWQDSQIDITNLDPIMDLIANENGQLTLQEDGSNPYAGYCYYPAGSYRKSSRNMEIILTAECAVDAGSFNESTFFLTDEFIITLTNNNGVLSKEN
ncbi:MAG: hypothetical protein F6K40_05150 [Okeania sp. SIO3I5]|uniref:CVNH domain-containing protein n=1 Tax=Okeania sp. SIO3I5 TaxID=2607805 RepID=UPI0013BB4346|nr:CVNH domain-containing protein [Okeania sp. SIO3I5]NEQ35709.1 hypothetical protein [Okeania sp. SIO3I5]